MKECIYSKFILDGRVADCEHFHPVLINEGISLYEVIRVIRGKFLFADDHIKRLINSSRLARLNIWYSEDEISEMIRRLPDLNRISEGTVKIVFNFINGKKHHFLAYFVPHLYPNHSDYEYGVKVITYPFIREDPNKKIWQPGFRADVNEIIQKKHVYEVLLVDENNLITEASRANFFTIRHDKVYTPPADKVLPGITRKYVLLICKKNNLAVIEKDIHVNNLKEYDAAFLTGTSPKVLPIAIIDHLNFGVSNKVLRLLMDQFNRLVEEQVG
ncbi:MAG: hypothetical protein AMS27_06640 [Bacteroides sp. SM23_62_1]|nr:MAG: hypothetical protein AMS27_06640 [Bacteroides sp. SM23_62_1]